MTIMKTIIYLMILFLFYSASSQPKKYEKQIKGDAISNNQQSAFMKYSNGGVSPLVYAPSQQSILKSANPTFQLDSIVINENMVREFIYETPCRLEMIVERPKSGYHPSDEEGIFKKTEFRYDETGYLSEIDFYVATNHGSLDLYRKSRLFYNSSDLLEKIEIFITEFENGNSPYIKCIFTYNESRQLIKADLGEVYYGWGPQMVFSTHKFIYNSSGKIQRYLIENVYDIQVDYEWNSEGDLVSEFWQNFGWNSKRLITYAHSYWGNTMCISVTDDSDNLIDPDAYVYNLDVDLENIVCYSYPDLELGSLLAPVEIHAKKQLLTYIECCSSGNTERSDYYYSSVVVASIHDLEDQTAVIIYPNPTTDYIIVESANRAENIHLKLVDLTGKTLLDKELYSGYKVALNDLPSGLYLFRIKQQSRYTFGKLILK